MSDMITNAAAAMGAVGSYIDEKRALIAAIERDMAITYRTFTQDLIEPLLECDDFYEHSLREALDVVQAPDEFEMEVEPERITALMGRYERFCLYPVAVIPLSAQSWSMGGVDRAGNEYDVEAVTFAPAALWQAIADSVRMPVTSDVHVTIHHADPMRVEVSVPDLPLLEIEDLRRFKAAFDREWAEAKFLAQMTYSEFFVADT